MSRREWIGLDKDGDPLQDLGIKDIKELENFENILTDDQSELLDEEISSNQLYKEILQVAPTMRPKIVNIVAITKFDAGFDLESIARQFRAAEYNPRRFKALIIRIGEPKATALIFSKGTMNVVGTRSFNDAKRASTLFSKMLQKTTSSKFRVIEFRIANIVSRMEAGFQINLLELSRSPDYCDFSCYNTELFSGCIFKVILSETRKVVLLIFQSGKIMCNGAHSLEEMQQAVNTIFPIIKKFTINTL